MGGSVINKIDLRLGCMFRPVDVLDSAQEVGVSTAKSLMLTSRQIPCFGPIVNGWYDRRLEEFEFYVLIKVRAPGCQRKSGCTQAYAQVQTQG